jgi:very-short-patch-repair endonuclease
MRSVNEAQSTRAKNRPDDAKRIAATMRAAIAPDYRPAPRRGPRSIEERTKMALTRQQRVTHQGAWEDDILRSFVDGTPQWAVGPYNIDIAIGTVAVEILDSAGRGSRQAYQVQRSKYLGDRGWHVYVIRPTKRGITPRVLDDLRSFVDQACRNPAMPCQYRVVGGRGYLISAGRLDGDDITFVAAHRGMCHPACGHPLVGD